MGCRFSRLFPQFPSVYVSFWTEDGRRAKFDGQKWLQPIKERKKTQKTSRFPSLNAKSIRFQQAAPLSSAELPLNSVTHCVPLFRHLEKIPYQCLSIEKKQFSVFKFFLWVLIFKSNRDFDPWSRFKKPVHFCWKSFCFPLTLCDKV